MAGKTISGLPQTSVAPPYFDKDGRFRSVEHATQHAILVQGGFTTTEIEAERMTRSTDEIERTMGERFIAGDPLPVLDPAPSSTRTMYEVDSEALTIKEVDSPSVARKTTLLRRLRKNARKVLAARKAEAEAKKVVEDARPQIIEDAAELGLDVIELEMGEGIQIVKPVMRKVIGQDDLIKAIERHRPEWLDTIAPAKRTVSLDQLSTAIEQGNVPASWRKFIAETEGTVQLKRVPPKAGK